MGMKQKDLTDTKIAKSAIAMKDYDESLLGIVELLAIGSAAQHGPFTRPLRLRTSRWRTAW
jgi:hypothetical protein